MFNMFLTDTLDANMIMLHNTADVMANPPNTDTFNKLRFFSLYSIIAIKNNRDYMFF